ncbi:MAG: 50S ribosomal protein L11 methyltransferase [Oscillospiraceae bacterium]
MNNEWTELQFEVDSANADTAAAIATVRAAGGLYIEDYSDMDETLPTIGIVDYVDDELAAKSKTRAIIHLYIPADENPEESSAFISEHLRAAGIVFDARSSSIKEDDWANNWKRFFFAERVGDRLVICPSWDSFDALEGDVVVTLDPGSSFGSGKHETTRLCLELIEKYIHGNERVLDMGCGSGILAIAALMLGASSASGVDVEQGAVKTAIANAALNGVDVHFDARCGDVLTDSVLAQEIGGGYDVICANIVADVLIAMKRVFCDELKSGGALLASGIIDTREREVALALTSAGLTLSETREQNGWYALVFTKP